jgi:nucleoid DNA-binding protein
MTKDELVREVAFYSGYAQPVVKEVVEKLIEGIRRGVEREGIVRVGGLGAFVKKVRKGRVYYGRALNGKVTPPPVEYPDTSVVRFAPSTKFKESLSPPDPA